MVYLHFDRQPWLAAYIVAHLKAVPDAHLLFINHCITKSCRLWAKLNEMQWKAQVHKFDPQYMYVIVNRLIWKLSPCKRPPPCLCSWSNDWSNSVLSDTESVSMMSLAENSQGAIQGHRGRLNATGGTKDLSAHSEKCRDTPISNRDFP